MSIIHDALKKVQASKPAADDNMPVSSAPDISRARPSSLDASSGASSTLLPKPVLIILMSVVSIVVVALFIVLVRLAQQTTVHPKIIPETPPLTVSIAVEGQPLQLESLRLEGIMNMGNKKVALINGNIYEEGETVEGMTVVKVTDTNVTVQLDGAEKILKIKP